MWIDTAIAASAAGPHPPNIHLRLAFNPAHLSRMLDSVASGGRQALVVDAQGRWVAASQGLRSLNLPTAQQDLAGLALAQASASAPARAVPWSAQPQLLGRGLSQANPAVAGSHRTTLVLQPVDEALAPIDAVAQAFWAVLVVVLLATLAAGAWGAARIVRPVAALTEATQRYQREGRLPAANAARSHISEIDALGRAYLAMMASVQQSRRELVRSAKLAMLGEFAAVMAHEVRTPLGILRSSAQVLLREPGLSANSRELMGFIESETERLNRLVNTLLDTARPRPPAFGPCDLNEVVQRCLQMQAVRHSEPGPHPAMQLDLQAQAPQLQADAEQLMQAIFNLLSNALQAAGPQGQVRLSTADAGEWLQLRCEDDGPGIAPAVAEHLFDPFVSGREGGIGLGLAVVRQIVDAHGGRISVGQGALGGAAFTVLLPRQHMADAIQKGCP
jgi:signal transduction histidine kinase